MGAFQERAGIVPLSFYCPQPPGIHIEAVQEVFTGWVCSSAGISSGPQPPPIWTTSGIGLNDFPIAEDA